MRNYLKIGVCGLAVLVAACTPDPVRALSDDESRDLIRQSRDAAKQLGTRLKAELVRAMEAGGPAGGVEVCAEIAAEIASEISLQTGMEVGRTAIRFRNPGNMPDEFETYWIRSFIADMDAGKPASDLEAWTVVLENGKSVFRWIKPIEMGGMCQTCHGTDLSPDVLSVIRQHYPEDQAVGFSAGELRGAFTISRSLE